MKTLKPSEKRHQRTEQAILDAARQIIHEEGASALSMRAIAQRIDYSAAGLYEYFDSKEEIIGAICQQGHRRLKAYMERIDPKLSFGEYLLGIGQAYIEFAVQNPDYFLLMFTFIPSEAPSPEAVEQQIGHNLMGENSSFVILFNAIKRGMAEGVLHSRPDFDLMGMAFAAWSVVHGIAMLRVTHLRTMQADFDMVTRETLLAFGRGLTMIS